MKWNKLGRIFSVNQVSDKLYSHAASPVPLYLGGDIFRIFVSVRDKMGIARPYFIDIDIVKCEAVDSVSQTPVIELGDIGTFDESGIILTSLLAKEDKVFYYYVGFPNTAKIFYRADSGLAIGSTRSKHAQKLFEGPVKSTSKNEKFFSSVQDVIYDNGVFKMWYVSGVKWEQQENGSIKHFYNIKYSESIDGIDWSDGIDAITFKNNHEYALARACIVKDSENDYKMWYCYRAQENIDAYRIGYAISNDGIDWIRKDELVGIDVSETGWDSEMICYPYVFDHKGSRYMLYNGNGYGKTGFGLAVLEDK